MNTTHYRPREFKRAPKFDAHLHCHSFDASFLPYCRAINLRLLTINTDLGVPIDRQFEMACSLKQKYPAQIDFVGTFDAAGFASASFAHDAIAQIKKCVNAGARGIKIWKNIGMSLRDGNGRYVTVSDAAFAPVFAYLERENIPLLTHLGEPRNCWLPLDDITTEDDRAYYSANPEYYMYLHPEIPSYEQQIAARDYLLEQYPRLRLIGAHLGSMESDLGAIAMRFDRYPQFYVDLSARISHIQLHAIRDREKVIDFFERYSDRIMYGSDDTISPSGSWRSRLFPRLALYRANRAMRQQYRKHWLYLSSDRAFVPEKFTVPNLPKTVHGLHLPKAVVNRVFYENAARVYGG